MPNKMSRWHYQKQYNHFGTIGKITERITTTRDNEPTFGGISKDHKRNSARNS